VAAKKIAKKSGGARSFKDKLNTAYGDMMEKKDKGACCAKCGEKGRSCECKKA